MKALLLEDRQAHIVMATEVLKKLGYEVEHYDSVETAKKSIQENYDLYAIDNRLLGEQRGIDFSAELRQNHPLAKIIVNSMDDLWDRTADIGVLFTPKDYQRLEVLIRDKNIFNEEISYVNKSLEALHCFLIPERIENGIQTLEKLALFMKGKDEEETIHLAVEKAYALKEKFADESDPFGIVYVDMVAQIRDVLDKHW